MGVLLCGGTRKEKAEVLYGIMQNGGSEAHSHIAASEDDFLPTLRKVYSLSTYELYKWV
jgi:hypothetical protein